MTSITSCPICGNNLFRPFLQCIDYTVSHEKFSLHKCSTCNFTLTSPRPTDEVIGSYYLSNDYISHSNKATSIIDHLYLLARKFTLRWKINLLTKNSEGSRKRILDYGSGTGAFLQYCTSQGWAASGVEPSENARSFCQKNNQLSVYQSINEIEEDKFNAITLWHVLEHIPDLDCILQQLKSKLSSTGTLFIAVPNHTSWDGRHYKEYWAGYDVPRHLWHFSRENMDKLLNKNGLTVTKVIPMKLDAYYISLLSEKYKRKKSTIFGMIVAFINGTRSNWQAARTGEYSSLIYIVKR